MICEESTHHPGLYEFQNGKQLYLLYQIIILGLNVIVQIVCILATYYVFCRLEPSQQPFYVKL